MTTPTLYTGKQMLLDYYNKQKNMQLTLDDVVFGTPQRREEDGALTNSWVRIYPAKGSGLTGAPKIYYDRVHMTYVGSIVVEKGTAIRTHDLLNKINEKYNTVFSEDDVENEILDPVAVGEIFISLKIKEESVTYYDGEIIYTNRYPDPADLPQPEIEKMATWSIADSSINAVVTNAELTAEVNRSNMVVATLPLSAPKTYFEVKVETNGAIIGLARKDANKTNANGVVIGGDNLSWGLNTATGVFTHNGQTMTYCPPVPVGSTVGVLIDLTSGVLSYQVGTVLYGVAAIGLEQFSDLYPAACGASASTQSKFTANFGQVPMTNTPPYDFRRGVYTVKQTMPNTGTGGYDVPDAGTLFDTYCKGQDLWGALADGEGGVVTTLLQASSFTCGAAANVVANLSVNPAELEIAKGTLAETTFTLSRGLEEPVNFLVSVTYEGLANQSYHGALQVRIGASAVNNINGGKITIPAGDTSFIIRTMLTSGYVAQPGDFIKIKLEVEPSYVGLITNTEPVIFDIKLLDQSNLPVGTLISTYCNGFSNFGVFADGAGGTYEEVIESNSEACGYVPFVLRTVRVTGTGTFDLPLGVDTVSITGQGDAGNPPSYVVSGVINPNITTQPEEENIEPIGFYRAWDDTVTYKLVGEYLYYYNRLNGESISRTMDFAGYEDMSTTYGMISFPVRFGGYYYYFKLISTSEGKSGVALVRGRTLNDVQEIFRSTIEMTIGATKDSNYYTLVNMGTSAKLSISYDGFWIRCYNKNFRYSFNGEVGPNSGSGFIISRDGLNWISVSSQEVGNEINSLTVNTSYIGIINATTRNYSSVRTTPTSQTDVVTVNPPIPFLAYGEVTNSIWTGQYFLIFISQTATRNDEVGRSFMIKGSEDCLTWTSEEINFRLFTIVPVLNGFIATARANYNAVQYNNRMFFMVSKDGITWNRLSTGDGFLDGDSEFTRITVDKQRVILSTGRRFYVTTDGENFELLLLDIPEYYSEPNSTKLWTAFFYDKRVMKIPTRPGILKLDTYGNGSPSVVTVGNVRQTFTGGEKGIKPPVENYTIPVDSATQTQVIYDCQDNTSMDIVFTARRVNYPAVGTVLQTTCDNFDKVTIYADGNNGQLVVADERNSPDCGYNANTLKKIILSGINELMIPAGVNRLKIEGRGGIKIPEKYAAATEDIYGHPVYTNVFYPLDSNSENYKIPYANGVYTFPFLINNYVVKSTDRVNWTAVYRPPNVVNGYIFSHKNKFVLKSWGYSNDNWYYSDDAENFTQFTLPDRSYSLIFFNNGYWYFANGISVVRTNDFVNFIPTNTFVDVVTGREFYISYHSYMYGHEPITNILSIYGSYLKWSDGVDHNPIPDRFFVEVLNDNNARVGPLYQSSFTRVTPGTDIDFPGHGNVVKFKNSYYGISYDADNQSAIIYRSSNLTTWVEVAKLDEIDDFNNNSLHTDENRIVARFAAIKTYFVSIDGVNWQRYKHNAGRPTDKGMPYGAKINSTGGKLWFFDYFNRRYVDIVEIQQGQSYSIEKAKPAPNAFIAVDGYDYKFPGNDSSILPDLQTTEIVLDTTRSIPVCYDAPEGTYLTVEFMSLADNNPAAGTLLDTYCEGFTQYRSFANGVGGTYKELVEYNSPSCGYVPPVIMGRFVGPTGITLQEGSTQTDYFYITNNLDVDLGFDIAIDSGQQTLDGIQIEYKATLQDDFVVINNNTSIVVPANQTGFYIRVNTASYPDATNATTFSIVFTPTLNASRLLNGSLQSTTVSVIDKEYVTVPTVFSTSNITTQSAGLAPNGYVGYVDNAAMLVTEDKIGTGKYYIELDYFDSGLVIGIVDEGSATTDLVNPIYPGSTSQSWGVSNYQKHVTGVSSSYSINWSNKVIGLSYDGQTGEACLYMNGVSQGVAFIAPNSGNLRFAVGYTQPDYISTFSVNFGHKPMKFPQVGFKSIFGKSYLKDTEPPSSIPSEGYLTPTSMEDQTPDSESYVRGEGYFVELATSSIVRSKIPLSGGSWVWEVTTLSGQNIVVGVALPDQRLVNLDTGIAYVGDSSFSWGVNMNGIQKYHNGAAIDTNLSAGDSITVSLRFKNPEGRLEADFGNGYETMFTGIPEGVYPAISVLSIENTPPVAYVNFGQAKFMNTVPTQYWPGLGLPTRNPPTGIYVGTVCEGFNKKVNYSNGSGGTYSEIVEYNSEYCGFSIQSNFYESDNLTKVGFNNRDDTEATINLYNGPYTVFSKTTLNGQNYYFEVDTDTYSDTVLVGVGSKEQALAAGHPGEGENRIVIDMSTGTIHLGSGQTDNRFEADYATKLAGGLVGFYYEGATTKQVTLYFKDKTTVTLPYTINEAGNTIKMLVGIDAVDTYGVLVNQGQYEFGYTPPTGALRVSPALPEASYDWIDNGNGRILNINKSSNDSIGTHAGKHTLLSAEILDEYKYMWIFYIPYELEKPFYGIGMDGLVIENIDYKTAMGVTVIDTSTGSIYCDGVESQFPVGAWDDNIRNNGLAFLYDGVTRTIKLYSDSGVTYDLPHPATSLPMRILVATTGYEDGLNYASFNIGREDIYMNVPPGYGTVINPMIPLTTSLYWSGNRSTSTIKTYYEKEDVIDSTPGYASMLSKTRIDGGKYYWETSHYGPDTALMVGVAEGTLPETSIPGSAGHISIALDYATGNVIRSDGTIFNDLVPMFESSIKDRTIGMGYDNVNNAFVVIIDYQPYSFPLHAVPSTLHVVVGNGSNTEGITAAYVNLGQDYFYYGLFNGFDHIEQKP